MGLPGSGKTNLAKKIVKALKADWLNADKIRNKYNDWDFSRKGIIRQVKRMRDLGSRSNSAIYVDIEINKKIIRIYNVHLESFSLTNTKDLTIFQNSRNELYESVSKTFSIQQDQLEIIEKNISKSPHDIIFSADRKDYIYIIIEV